MGDFPKFDHNYVMEREVAIVLCFQLQCMLHLLHSVTNEEQHTKCLCSQSSTENTGGKHDSQHSHREATSHYHKATP